MRQIRLSPLLSNKPICAEHSNLLEHLKTLPLAAARERNFCVKQPFRLRSNRCFASCLLGLMGMRYNTTLCLFYRKAFPCSAHPTSPTARPRANPLQPLTTTTTDHQPQTITTATTNRRPSPPPTTNRRPSPPPPPTADHHPKTAYPLTPYPRQPEPLRHISKKVGGNSLNLRRAARGLSENMGVSSPLTYSFSIDDQEDRFSKTELFHLRKKMLNSAKIIHYFGVSYCYFL